MKNYFNIFEHYETPEIAGFSFSEMLVTNNQTSTTFRYGTTMDTYIIFCIAMASDANLQGITLLKNCTPDCYSELNEDIGYTLTVKNTGNVNISNITLTDNMALAAPVKVSGDINANGILETTETWVYTAGYRIKQGDLNAGYILNTATVSGKDPKNTVVSASASSISYKMPLITSAPKLKICSGSLLNYDIMSEFSASYTWSRPKVTGISNLSVSGQTSDPIKETLINTSSASVDVTYLITPSANGCPGPQFSFSVSVNPKPTVSSPSSGLVCSGEAQQYDIKSEVSGTTYSWSRLTVAGISNAEVSSLSSDHITESLINITTTAVNVSYLIIPTADGCTGEPFTYTVKVNAKPKVITSQLTQTICSGGSSAMVTITSDVAGATFLWTATATSDVSGFTASGTGIIPVQTISTTGTDQGRVTFAIIPTASGCSGSSTNYIVIVNPNPVINLGNVLPVCSGISIILDAGDHFIQYLWNTGDTTQTLVPTPPGQYSVMVTDSNHCRNADTINITSVPSPVIFDLDTLINRRVAIFASDGTEPYQYSINGIDFQSGQIFKDLIPDQYTITVKDANNCLATKALEVFDHRIEIPNFFTPNNDGIHDTWEIKGIQAYPDARIQIFDRFGKLLASYSGTDTGWNGIYQDGPIKSDDYWYLIIMGINNLVYKGHVTLKR